MTEENTEAKEIVEQKETQNVAEETREDASDKMDEILDNYEKGLDPAPVTSTEEKSTDEETKPEEAIVEPDNAKKEAEPEETKESDVEGEIPQEFHKHPAWIKQREKLAEAEKVAQELKTKLSTEKSVEIENVINSPAYIRAKMEGEGYKEEVIGQALEKAGYKAPVESKEMVDTVIEKLGYDKANLTQEQLDYIHDITKISNIINQSSVDPLIQERLEKVENVINDESKIAGAESLVGEMQKTVTGEGILDYKIDIEPQLHKYLDDNPQATQQEINGYFKDLNHSLVLERGSLASKKADRDVKKGVLKQNTHSVGKSGMQVPDKTGDPNTDADNFLDSIGMHS